MDEEKHLHELEQQREGDMIRMGRDRYNYQLKKNVEKGRNSVTPPYIYLQKELLVPLSEGIQAFIDDAYTGKAGSRKTAAEPLRDLDDPKRIALITLKGIIDGIALNKNLLQISLSIGNMVQLEEQNGIFKKTLPYLHSRILKDLMTRTRNVTHRRKVFAHTLRKYNVEHTNWSTSKTVLVGQQLIDITIRYTGLCNVKSIKTARNKDQNLLVLKPEIVKRIDEGNFKCSVLTPYHKPMIVKPRDWSSPFSGGYVNEYLSKSPLVKTHDFKFLASFEKILDHLYRCIT